MKRDPRLRGLSEEHHQALVLARSVSRAQHAWTPDEGAALRQRFDVELEPHFQVEEALLLPALLDVGERALVARALEDHRSLRATISAAAAGDGQAAAAFGARMREHVRFEERELFPACERLLAADILDEVARRRPKLP